MLKTLLIAAAAIATLPLPAGAFEISFNWDGLKLCNTGRPNIVHNPEFTLKDVPEGTKYIRFRLTDRNVPSFNHGGGTVAYTGQKKIAPGAFKYQSPCPPGGAHVYEWTATTASKKTGGKLSTAKARRSYPE